MRFAFILEEKAHFPVRCLCTVLEVTRSGFYAWCARPVAARTHDTQRLAVEVAAIHAASKQRYGSPRVHQELQAQGRTVGRHRVARLMQQQGLRAGKAHDAGHEVVGALDLEALRVPRREVPVPHELIAGEVEEGLGEEVEDRVGRQGTDVADHAGGGEAVLGGQHGVEVRQAAPFRRCGRSEEHRDRRQVGVAYTRRGHRAKGAGNANGRTGSTTPGMR